MDGNKASSFVNQLKKMRYKALATIATNKGYFNSPQAYRSLGFNEISFLEENGNFKKTDGDVRIFDGILLEHNLIKVRNILKESDSPIFNYVLGMYGHVPYERNLKERPDVIDVNHDDRRIHRIANQFYYRTKAIAEYIKGILYSSNINISVFHSADEFEIVRQQRTQFALIFARISEEFLTSGFEFGKRFEVLVVQGFLLEEFPEAFDQIQIRRIGREEYELDA